MKFEIKETLAKLLATENLIVEHRKVDTASFNVESRVLTLPMWERASNRVYDLLVGHEVGHALYTPNEDWKKDTYAKVPMSFVNVVEDARIEKLMKRRYAGLSKTFYNGYQELHDEDFFSVQDEEMNSMSFIDRLNLYYKIGAYHMISFSSDEEIFVDRTGKNETWNEVLELSYDIYMFLKSKEEEPVPQKINLEDLNQGQGNDENNTPIDLEPSDMQRMPSIDDSDGVSEDADIDDPMHKSDDMDGGSEGGDEFESKTDNAFQENQEKFINQFSLESSYLKIPKDFDMERIIIDCNNLQRDITTFYNGEFCSYDKELIVRNEEEYRKYKKNATKGVNYLVKEFEMKKSADEYSRSSISKTGVLDCTKLHTYKFNEDLFKKVTVIPEGKNHGLVFILDWSGSMANVIHDTVKQLLNLLWFCKKTNIPFEVYAFTYEYPLRDEDFDEFGKVKELQELEVDDLYLHKSFRLLNLVSHKRTSSQFENDCLNLWRLGTYTRYHGTRLIPHGLGLSGTPLNETLITMHKILPQFIKETGVSKVNAVFLTDGESNGLGRVSRMSEKYYPDRPFGKISVNGNCKLRDIKNGRTYKTFNENLWDTSATHTLLTNLKDNFPAVNLISYRIIESRDVSNVHFYYTDQYSCNDKKKWMKERSAILNTTGYDAMYAIASTSMNQSDEFDVDDGATNAQIRAAFKKSLKSKAANKKVLSSFATMVA